MPDVRGRITYISSHAKQENLYAVYETTDRCYWTELAKCNQQEFQKSGTEGKGIEARELSAKLFEKETVRTIAEPSEGRMAQIIPQTDKTPKQEKITHKEPTDDLSTQ